MKTRLFVYQDTTPGSEGRLTITTLERDYRDCIAMGWMLIATHVIDVDADPLPVDYPVMRDWFDKQRKRQAGDKTKDEFGVYQWPEL